MQGPGRARPPCALFRSVAAAAAEPMDEEAPNPYKFIGFGDSYGSKPCKFTGFGDSYGPKPYKFTGFGDSYGPKPYKFTGFGDGYCMRFLSEAAWDLASTPLVFDSWVQSKP